MFLPVEKILLVLSVVNLTTKSLITLTVSTTTKRELKDL